jgi:malate/lactate dehydrogenase
MKPDILELVAEDVHTEWANEKQRQGYADHTLGTCLGLFDRDNPCQYTVGQHHTDMLPYASLPEPIKEYDRVTAKTVIDSLKNRGYLIIHLKTGEEI